MILKKLKVNIKFRLANRKVRGRKKTQMRENSNW